MSDVKNVLIFCPKFFNYDINIRNAVQKNGYTVSLFNERPFDNIIGRVLIRLGFDFFLKRQIFKYYKNIYGNIFADIDYLIVINPECITPEILEIYRNKCNNIIVYMWDSFENKPQAKKLIRHADLFYTFDPNDAKNNNIIFKPLFYTKAYREIPSKPQLEYDISFIGTIHSSRYQYVKSIATVKNKFIFFYCPSLFVFLFKKYIAREIECIKLKDVSFKSLSESEVLNVIKRSRCILDVVHPKQNGLTIRTIEALGANKKIITTNRNVVKYDFYNPSNILVLDDTVNDVAIAKFINQEYVHPDDEIYQSYYIENWVKDLLRE